MGSLPGDVKEGLVIKQETFNYKGLNITFDWKSPEKKLADFSKRSHRIRITRLKDGKSKTYKSIREATRLMHETFNFSVSQPELIRRVKLGPEYKGHMYERVEC